MITIEDPTLETDVTDKDILLCLRTLCSTVAGTIPLDRDFGLDPSITSKPIETVENLYATDVMEKAEKYETRIKVTEVTFEQDGTTLKPVIHFEKITSDDEEEEET